MNTPKTIHETIKKACDTTCDLNELSLKIADALNRDKDDIVIIGPQFGRIVLIMDDTREKCTAIFVNTPYEVGADLSVKHPEISVIQQTEYVTELSINEAVLEKLLKPNVKLVALYHPENFPLPRFPLGISDIAAALRANLLGQVLLTDMQLGESIQEIVDDIEKDRPDVVGISATFGQQDKLEELVSMVEEIPEYNPLIIFGGSLSALNADSLLKKYPEALVATGYGETTMKNIVEYWHGMRSIDEINSIAYVKDGVVVRTRTHTNDKDSIVSPELDLLDRTLEKRGVMQLETSRGCTYACSFCPRGHKGLWFGDSDNSFETAVKEIKKAFERHPEIAPKIFLVDEEFLGYTSSETGTLERAKKIARTLQDSGFTFESSTRIDQVYRTNKKADWHERRIHFWRYLRENGLDRMLFGVESGVDSILKRFNKRTTREQNVRAVRILTSCGVPVRLTYITFDPLMTMEELIETYQFQGRRDILMERNDDIEASELYTAVEDEDYVENHSKDVPYYREIPYMLVSMECLLGSPYLYAVEKEGLAGDLNLNMGKKDARYANKDIGLMSLCSQQWIDRNFSLDYLLKSLIKVSTKENMQELYELRWVIKDYAYELLGVMLATVNNQPELIPDESTFDVRPYITNWENASNDSEKKDVLTAILDTHFENLKSTFLSTYNSIAPHLKHEDAEAIQELVDSWSKQTTWTLINA